MPDKPNRQLTRPQLRGKLREWQDKLANAGENAAYAAVCEDMINKYRDMLGRPSLTEVG